MPFTKIDNDIKMSQTDDYVFFLNGPFSQWHPSEFQQRFTPNGPLFKFNCAEQYMMAAKAKLFGDEETYAKIMAVEQNESDWRIAPRRCKELGREIAGFDVDLWATKAEDIVFRGNWAKFNQNGDLGVFLFNTANKVLVEGAHYDTVWGVGLAWNDEAIIDPKNWRGTNWLGQALMRVRYHAREILEICHVDPYAMFDEWRCEIVDRSDL